MGDTRNALPHLGRTDLLVVQSTTFCNLNCSYCYLPDRSVKKRMDLRTVELIGRRVLKQGWTTDDVTLVWHAGEPLVVPPDWYDQAIPLLARYCPDRVRLVHSVQTNGTLIDASWVELFKRHNFRIGVSVDGPALLHDARRRTRDGRGTFNRTMAGIRTLQDAGLPFHVITVLTADSLRKADELFEFYVEAGVERVCLNIEEIEGVNESSSLAGEDIEDAFKVFISRFITLNASSPRPLWVREIASSMTTILAPVEVAGRNQQVEPLAILTVDVDGNLSTFSPELIGARAPEFDDFRFVNLKDGGPEILLSSPSFRRTHAAILAGIEKCRRSCPWFQWCGGGAPGNKFFETGSLAATETLYCRLTKQAVMDVVLHSVEAGQLSRVVMAAGGRCQ